MPCVGVAKELEVLAISHTWVFSSKYADIDNVYKYEKK